MATKVQACTHHWVIAPPDGETSTGVCKLCGARKEFANAHRKGNYNRNYKWSKGGDSDDDKDYAG